VGTDVYPLLKGRSEDDTREDSEVEKNLFG